MIGIYSGSFDPFHEGHFDVLQKASAAGFSKIIIAVGENPQKKYAAPIESRIGYIKGWVVYSGKLETPCTFDIVQFSGLLSVNLVNNPAFADATSIIRGLRNFEDFEYEKMQQYTNEDLGIKIPTMYFMCDRKYSHISSTSIKIVASLQGANNG